MRFFKKAVKFIFGISNTKIVSDIFRKFFKTKSYIEETAQKEKSINFYKEFIKEGDICFDVGANMGSRIEVFLNLKAKVIAVEPQKGCIKYLRGKYKDRIIAINKAVGAAEENMVMYISKYSSTLSSLSKDWIDAVKADRYKDVSWNKKEMVEVTTINTLILKYGIPSFIKIDVEGYELEVLKGLNYPVKMLSFEYTLPEQLQKTIDCLQILMNIDEAYECNYSLSEDMKYQNNEFINIGEMINFIQTNKIINSSVGDIYVRKIL